MDNRTGSWQKGHATCIRSTTYMRRIEHLKAVPRIARIIAGIAHFIGSTALPASGGILDTMGVTLLRTVTTNLDGTGIRVAHPEASTSTSYPTFEVNPAVVGHPVSRFTYYSTNGISTNFPNTVGDESTSHGDGVGQNFYGTSGGIATNVVHVDNYDADYFINTYVMVGLPGAIPGGIVNQSFAFLATTTNQQMNIDFYYDTYAAKYGTLFVSAAGPGGGVAPPGTSYNCISVDAIDGGSSVGPTPENQRCKPDLVAYGGASSFATPYVSGAATVLMQAGLRGDGGNDTNSAAKAITLKAVLLNGAIKPTNWTHIASAPLDFRYGAGLLNVFNSYKQLAGGKQAALEQTSVNNGNPHPPGSASGNISTPSGWDFATLTSSASQDRISHYYFNVTNGNNSAPFTLTATLTWNRTPNPIYPTKPNLNNLDLFLYDASTGNLIAASVSGVDNVEHLYVTGLSPGRYDLQVLKYGGTNTPGNVTTSETYALAWEFFTLPLAISQSGTTTVLSWPIYPAGFTLESATSFSSSAWSAVTATPVVTNGSNYVTLNATNTSQLFRLRRP
jgi:hypothetical protein